MIILQHVLQLFFLQDLLRHLQRLPFSCAVGPVRGYFVYRMLARNSNDDNELDYSAIVYFQGTTQW